MDKKKSKIFFKYLACFLGLSIFNISFESATSAMKSWTLDKELAYLDGLIARGVRFNSGYEFLFLLKEISSQKRSKLLSMDDDFVFIIQASTENPISRAVLASKCGSDIYCSVMITYDFDSIEYHPIYSKAFRFVCPESKLYPLIYTVRPKLFIVDAPSNYLVCQANGKIHRFANYGGGSLPTKDLGMIDKYLSETYPGLF